MRRANYISNNAATTEESPYNVESLTTFSDDREAEIERMCNSNHQDFVSSVNQLLSVRKGTYDLTSEILRLNQTIQASTEKLVEQKKALVESRDVRANIDEAGRGLRMCLEVLRLANKVKELLAAKSHYQALRTLDELQNVHLKEVLQFSVAEFIRGNVPAMQRMIKDAVMSDLNAWLYRIRETSQLLGQVAFDQTELRRRRQRERGERQPWLRGFKLNSAIELVLDERDEAEWSVFENEHVKVDFEPLFECLHIYDALGEREEFRAIYADTRQQQKDLLLNGVQTLNLSGGENGEVGIGNLAGLLEQIAGFAILERETVRRTGGFRSEGEVERLWDSMVKKAVGLMGPAVNAVQGADLLLKVKNILALFVQTMDTWEYNTTVLDEFLLTLFNKYSELLKTSFRTEFTEIVSTDDYMPMAIASPEEYDNVVSVSWYKPDRDRSEIQFPCVFPFSKMYPLCCLDIRNFLNKYYVFSDEYFQQQSIIDSSVKDSLDELLCNQVCRSLVEKLESKYLGQIVQILINLEHFEFVCGELEKLLGMKMKGGSAAAASILTDPLAEQPKVALRATASFQTEKKTAEKRIFELVNSKIDDLVETAEYNWSAKTPSQNPSLYLQEMTRFLSNIMNSTLLGLPRDIKGLIYFDALSHLASSILQLPLADEVKSISPAVITDLDTDVCFLQGFVDALPAGGGAGVVGGVFEELRQTVDLLVKVAKEGEGAAEEFYDVGVRMRKYAAVSALSGPMLVEKVLIGRAKSEEIPHALGRRCCYPQSYLLNPL
ncbi:exocyst complex subunit Sec15-like-domain-containing protein [Tirmania nivea]|nr:exocyst complex subunit Sec15-like-domain-containing protein [Tirmania nivea]